jgi:hypothetical protein
MASEHDEKVARSEHDEKVARLYHEAKVAVKLLDGWKHPTGQLYALECIAEGKEIKTYTFPSLHRNTDYEKAALYNLSTVGYKSLTKEDAMREYVSFVKMLLQNHKYSEVVFANKILIDQSISSLPKVTSNPDFF